MRKNDLIKRLQEIEGNPEIVVWNGFVEDYQPLKGLSIQLIVKECRQFVTKCLASSGEGTDKESVDEAMSYRKWGLPNQFIPPEQYKLWYGSNQQKVIMLSPGKRGEVSRDRLGEMHY